MSYDTRLSAFVDHLIKTTDLQWAVEPGRKFDKVYINSQPHPVGQYMVEKKTGNIYAIKSWAQVNTRRWYGTLDTIDQVDWNSSGKPKVGSELEKLVADREAGFVAGYKKRGRPRKVLVTS